MALSDIDISALPGEPFVVLMTSTVGHGRFPFNATKFWKAFVNKSLSADFLRNTKFAVFGLGDRTYEQFSLCARLLDDRMAKLGAQRLLPVGCGDDSEPGGFETGWKNWKPLILKAIDEQHLQ